MSLPMTNDASGEISQDTVAAISSGLPIRPSGLCSAASRAAGSAMSVSLTPGETLLTRTPSEATSLDRPRECHQSALGSRVRENPGQAGRGPGGTGGDGDDGPALAGPLVQAPERPA